MPGQLRGSVCEDPPLFSSELTPAYAPSIRQSVVGPIFQLFATYLGDQWRVGDWEGYRTALGGGRPEPPQNLKEYDPEWGRAFWTGTVAASCDHARMLKAVKVPVLFTHHFRRVDETTGFVMGAISDLQAGQVRALVEGAGQPFDYRSFPQMGHAMHAQDPKLFADTLSEWALALPEG